MTDVGSTGAAPRQAGFTLVEVMVAFTILALSVGVVSVIFGNGLRLASAADEQTRALAVAEAKIAEFSVPEKLLPGLAQGMAGDMRWQTSVLPFFFDPQTDDGKRPPDYLRIGVRVFWGEGAAGQSLALDTIRLAPRGRPPTDDGEANTDEDAAGETMDTGTDGGEE